MLCSFFNNSFTSNSFIVWFPLYYLQPRLLMKSGRHVQATLLFESENGAAARARSFTFAIPTLTTHHQLSFLLVWISHTQSTRCPRAAAAPRSGSPLARRRRCLRSPLSPERSSAGSGASVASWTVHPPSLCQLISQHGAGTYYQCQSAVGLPSLRAMRSSSDRKSP